MKAGGKRAALAELWEGRAQTKANLCSAGLPLPVHNKESGNSLHLFMQSVKADKPSEQHWGLAEQPEQDSQRRLTGLWRSRRAQPQCRKGSTWNHRTRQNEGEHKIIHLVFSLKNKYNVSRGNGAGCAHLLRSIFDKKNHNPLPPEPDRQIRGAMGRTKELAKNCPKTNYTERGPTSPISHSGSQNCKIQRVSSLFLGHKKLQTKLNMNSCFLTPFFP